MPAGYNLWCFVIKNAHSLQGTFGKLRQEMDVGGTKNELEHAAAAAVIEACMKGPVIGSHVS